LVSGLLSRSFLFSVEKTGHHGGTEEIKKQSQYPGRNDHPILSTLHSLRGQTSSPRPLSPQRLTFSAMMLQEKPEQFTAKVAENTEKTRGEQKEMG
jgi:hypothetical protein